MCLRMNSQRIDENTSESLRLHGAAALPKFWRVIVMPEMFNLKKNNKFIRPNTAILMRAARAPSLISLGLELIIGMNTFFIVSCGLLIVVASWFCGYIFCY